MNRIRVDDMGIDQIDQLACNAVLLSLEIEEERKFRGTFSDFLALKREQKIKKN